MKHFKVITSTIILSLVIIFFVQLILLYGLYVSEKRSTQKDISAIIERADILYLSHRFESYSKTSKHKISSLAINDSLIVDDAVKQLSNVNQLSGILVADIGNNETIDFLEKVNAGVKIGLHEMIGQADSIDLNSFNQLVDSLLYLKGINAHVQYSEIINTSNEKISTSSPDNTYITNSEIFEYKHSPNSKYIYKVYTNPLTRTILAQIFGIITTSFLIFLVISLSIGYLVKVVLRQKTLEQMKEDFVNNMTHELKTPVSAAFSATDAVLSYPELESAQKTKYLKIATEQLKKLDILIEQILSSTIEVSNNMHLQKDIVLLKELIVTLIEQYNLTSKDCNITLSIVPENITVYADKVHLINVFNNLIVNSIKYSDNPVQIHIDIRKDNKNIIVSFKDTGNGIPKDKIRYIFDKFYRVSEGNIHNTKGYGLGLYYVKEIIKKHQGKISVESTLGKGTCFTILLPLNE